jgi:hypothetical protein
MRREHAVVDHPVLRQTVLDAEAGPAARALAEFYRELLGLTYRAGDEPPAAGEPDTAAGTWLALRDPHGRPLLAIQPVPALPEATWPEGEVPQQVHLDLTVPTLPDLDVQHDRALSLGARHLLDRREDPEEPLHVYADPAGHPFCVFVAPDDGR